MNGLHVCKPGNAPTVGQVKTFVISGDRIKSKKAEEGGQPYAIRAVTQNATYKDSYGNVGYDIEIEPAQGAQAPPQSTHVDRGGTGASSSAEYWARKEERDIESNRRQGRAHSQHMALLYFQMVGGFPEGEDPAEALRKKTDYFELDKNRIPKPKNEEVL